VCEREREREREIKNEMRGDGWVGNEIGKG